MITNKAKNNYSITKGGVMQLLTKAVIDRLPALYATDGVKDPTVQVKFFTPDSNWTGYAIEFDGQDTFYGYAGTYEKELGYFSLSEISRVRGKLGLPVERDMWFDPCKLSVVKRLQ